MSFQAAASSQGRAFEDVVEGILITTGWSVIARRWREPHTQVEIDIVASDPNGEVRWFECKGSWQSVSGRNGAIRTDTTKKLVADAALLSTAPERRPYLLVTSDMPDVGSPARRWLDIALEQGWLSDFHVVAMFGVRPTAPTAGDVPDPSDPPTEVI